MAPPSSYPTKAELELLKEELRLQKEHVDNLKTESEFRSEINRLKREERDLNESGDTTEANLNRLDQIQQQIDLQERLSDQARIGRAEQLRELRSIQQEIEEVNQKRKEANAELQEEIETLKDRATAAKANADADEDSFKKRSIATKARLKQLEAERKLAEKTAGTTEAQLDSLDENIKKQKKVNETIEKQVRLLDRSGEEADEASEGIKSMMGSLLSGDVKGAATNFGKVQKEFVALKGAGQTSGGAIRILTGNMGKFVLGGTALVAVLGGVALLFGKMAKGAAETAVALGDSQNQAAKLTGGNKELTKSMTNAFKETRKVGQTAEELGKTFGNLTTKFSNFTMESDAARTTIIKQTGVLEKLGVDSGATAANLQLLTKAMGQTGTAASDTTLVLAALGKDLGIDPGQLAKDFGAAGGQLAKLGSNGVQAFKQLAVASKATGLEIGKILGMVEKFDTFEGAATQAGKLNAALGGNFVNAMELMTATDPVERFNMIRDSILDTGLTFDEMSYYQRKFFTESAGLSDVSELAMMMSGNMNDLSGEVGKTSADYASAAKRAKDMAKFQEKLNIAMQQMIPVVEPLVEGVGDFATGLADFTEKHGETVLRILQGIGIALGIAGAAVLFFGATFMGPVAAVAALISGIAALGSILFETAFNPPSFFQGMKEMSDDFDGMSVNINKSTKTMHSFGNEVVATGNKTYRQTEMTRKAMPQVMQMTNTSMTNEIKKNQINNAMLGSSTATTNAMTNAVKNSTNNTTINNSGQGGSDTGINIKFDNKKFADLFDVQVEKSIGRAARKAVI